MPNCTRIKPAPYKVCTGDLRFSLVIKSRTKSATNGSVEPELNLATVATIFVMQKSIKGSEIFNGTDIVGQITDAFYFRYNPNLSIDITNIAQLGGEFYTVEEVDLNLEGRRQFGMIKCSKRGIDTLLVNRLNLK